MRGPERRRRRLEARGGVREAEAAVPAEEIRARVTVLADGTRGVLSEQLKERFGAGQNPQVYSLGIKAVLAASLSNLMSAALAGLMLTF